MNLEEKQKFLVNFAFFLTVFGITFFSLKFTFVYFSPFLIGVIIAYLMQKPAVLIASKMRLKKEKCAALLSVVTYAAVLLIFVLIGWFVIEKAGLLIDYLLGFGDVLKNISETVYKLLSRFYTEFNSSAFEKVIADTTSNFTTKAVSIVSNIVTSIIKNIPKLFFSAIVTVVASCYIAKDYDRLKQFIKGIISEKIYKNSVIIKNIFTDCILKFLFGYLKLSALTFIELLIGFFLLGIKRFFLIALLVSFVDLLPVFGTGTVLLPWSVILFLQHDYKLAFGIAVLYVIVSIVRNFAEPKIIGKQIGINPLFTLISMFVGLKIAGIAGAIIFPIAMIVIFTFCRNKIYTS